MNPCLYEIDSLPLNSGTELASAKVAYRTHGKLNSERSNVILLCSPVASDTETYDHLIGEGKAFDPRKYFIVSTALFGSGVSSSPSNTAGAFGGVNFPSVTIADNVLAQRILLEKQWGVSKLTAVCGFSMGAQQAFQWSVSFPGAVERVAAWCGHARTTPYTEIFLDGVMAALKASPDWEQGRYTIPPVAGLKAMSRAYAGWGMSAAWYREEGWRAFGCESKEEFLVGVLDNFFCGRDANNFICQFETWKNHNVGTAEQFGGDPLAALSTVQASVLIMPCTTDLYFPIEDLIEESLAIPNSRLSAIESNWGHWAGFGIDPENSRFLNAAITEHLNV